MRNDSHDDPAHWPHLRAEAEPIAEVLWARPARTGKLWALCWLLFFGLLGLSWWFDQRIMQLEQQLVATQTNFVRLSEANTRAIQVLERQREPLSRSAEQALSKAEFETRIEQLSQRLDQLTRQHPLLESQQHLLVQELAALRQQGVVGGQSLQTLSEQLTQQEQTHQQNISNIWTDWKTQQEQQKQQQLDRLVQLEEQQAQVQQQLKLNMNALAVVSSLEQELLVLRSSIERLPKPVAASPTKPSISIQEFDLFRAQATRNITSLQAQIANLQEQLDRRP